MIGAMERLIRPTESNETGSHHAVSFCFVSLRFLFSLPNLLKFIQRDSQLPQKFEKERRSNLAAAVERNRNSTAVRMIPPLVAS